jgi:exopolysaccharide production protein ExoQ
MNSSVEIAEEMSFRKPAGIGLAYAVGFFFSFRLFIMLLAVRVLGTDPDTGVEISLVLNFLLLGIVAFHSLGELRESFASMLHLASIRWVVAFLVFSGCSLAWSVAASLPAAMVYWAAMAADVAMVVMLLRAASVASVAHSLVKGFVWGACCIAVIAWALPAQSDLRLGDELLGPNQIGYLCGFAFFLAQYPAHRKDGKWGWAALLLAITLLRSLSKTTIIAALAGEIFLLVRDQSISRKTKQMIGVGAVVMVLAFSGLLASYYDVYVNGGNQVETLTGRVGIWAMIGSAAVEQPWIGHGFHAVWKVIPPFGPDQFEARHAHNELLQQFYAYGVAGVCLLVGLYGSLYRQIRSVPRSPLKTFFFGMLIFVLIRGLADTEPFDLSLPLWMIVLISLLMKEMQQESPQDISIQPQGIPDREPEMLASEAFDAASPAG